MRHVTYILKLVHLMVFVIITLLVSLQVSDGTLECVVLCLGSSVCRLHLLKGLVSV